MKQEIQQCNISGNEVKTRLYTGYFGLFGAIVSLIIIFIFKQQLLILFFIFIFISALGFIQAREHYCVYIGILDILKNPKKNREDLVHIFRSTSISALIAGLLTTAVYFILKFL